MNISIVLVICSSVLLSNKFASSNIVTDIAKSAVDSAAGVVQKIPDSIPSPTAIFEASKNVLLGYPIDVVFSAINLFCSAALSKNQVKPKEKFLPDLRKMNFILLSKENRYLVPLQKPLQLWKHKSFDPNLKTVILVTGWTSNINDTNDALEIIWEAYKCRGNVNFIAVDTAQFVDTLYTWSAFNTEEIGSLIAKALKELVSTYPVEDLHLIGHSLGAHIVGCAGRNFNYMTSLLLPRITGLDPANPCFNEGENLTGLSRGDADFVDVIHSNNGVLGKRDPIGDCDFYPNGLVPLPPGCLSIVCAHGRAWQFYAESVYPGNENSFEGVKCGSLSALNSGYCTGNKYPMGYAVPHNLKGNYFLETKSESPFGNNKYNSRIKCQSYVYSNTTKL